MNLYIKSGLTALTVVLCHGLAQAQELRCNVKVLSPQIQLTDKSIFETLEKSITEFMNTTKWTDDRFSIEERIECSILINITEQTGPSQYKATATIQSSRPVYHTNYNTVLVNHMDRDWDFEYIEFQPLLFNEHAFHSGLTSLLAFYAYLILGLDYDSFSPSAGTPFFQQANTVLINAHNAGVKGWGQKDGTAFRNRYWMIENILNPSYEQVRKVFYTYHRQAMDMMYTDVAKGRVIALECLQNLLQVHQDRPNSMIMQMFFAAKGDELADMFAQGPPDQKTQAVQVLSVLDAPNASRYQRILK